MPLPPRFLFLKRFGCLTRYDEHRCEQWRWENRWLKALGCINPFNIRPRSPSILVCCMTCKLHSWILFALIAVKGFALAWPCSSMSIKLDTWIVRPQMFQMIYSLIIALKGMKRFFIAKAVINRWQPGRQCCSTMLPSTQPPRRHFTDDVAIAIWSRQLLLVGSIIEEIAKRCLKTFGIRSSS